MIKKNRMRLFFCSLLGIFSLAMIPVVTCATEGTGGQVSTGGNISFYEVENVSDKDETQQSSSDFGSSATEKNPESVGRLPSTGEMIQRFGLVGLGMLFLLLWFIWKKIKEEK